MNEFRFYNPTEILFGRGQVKNAGAKVRHLGSKCLVVTFDPNTTVTEEVMTSLRAQSVDVFVLSGINSNPRIGSVRQGVDLVRTNGIDVILAIGGGSVIDCAKAIAVCSRDARDPWDVIVEDKDFRNNMPLGVVLTHAATGSEMNPTAVITNWEKQLKYTIHNAIFPTFSILDPTYTFTVPLRQTGLGIIDAATHVLEQYFSKAEETPIQDGWAEVVLRTLLENGDRVMLDPQNYDARANIMLSATMALNGLLGMGKQGDFASHLIEHEVSAISDIPHGAGMAIIFPRWMQYVLSEGTKKFVQYATCVFMVDPCGKSERQIAEEGIARTQEWFCRLGAKSSLSDYGLSQDNFPEIAAKALARNKKPLGAYRLLDEADVVAILEMCL
jgi:alcohol dehydrogenase YqhD (iron-dependent ADH family)